MDEEATDEELAVRTIKNPSTYDVLVNRHGETLIGFISRRFVRDRPSAEDVSQEAFMKAYLSIDTFDPSKRFKTWLYAIAVNTARSVLRKPVPEDVSLYANSLASGDAPEHHVELLLEHEHLVATLSCLEPHHRIVLDMHYGQGLTYAEIGTRLGLALGTVKTRIFRAKQQLVAHFKPNGSPSRRDFVEGLAAEDVDYGV